jgi:hypothetical protein
MGETDDDKPVPEKAKQERKLSEPYLVSDIYEDGLSDSVQTGGQVGSQCASSVQGDSIASQLSRSLPRQISVIEPPEGLHPVLLTGIVVNYISSGYILLPWGKLRPSSVPSTTVDGPSASHHSLVPFSLCTGRHAIIKHCTSTHFPSVVHDGHVHP